MATIKIKANVERTIMDALGVLFPKGYNNSRSRLLA